LVTAAVARWQRVAGRAGAGTNDGSDAAGTGVRFSFARDLCAEQLADTGREVAEHTYLRIRLIPLGRFSREG
jgi:hypothetical protein